MVGAERQTLFDALVAAGSGGPGAVEQPNDPAHISAALGDARASITNAVVLATGHSHVARATFAGGMLVLSDIDVTASVKSDGTTATPVGTVTIGHASVNGVGVDITDKGVVVSGSPQGGSDAATQLLNSQLNSALAGQGLRVFVVAPAVERNGVAASVAVSGVHVVYTEPPVDPSVPAQFVEYTLGDAHAFAFAVREDSIEATIVDDATLPDVTSVVDTPVVEAAQFTNDGFGTDAVVTPAVTVAAPIGRTRPKTQPAAFVKRPLPKWLGVLYLIWLWLMVATAGVVVWWRRGDRLWEPVR